jgi:hypothetical protein
MFLEKPEKDWERELNDLQLSLFLGGFVFYFKYMY